MKWRSCDLVSEYLLFWLLCLQCYFNIAFCQPSAHSSHNTPHWALHTPQHILLSEHSLPQTTQWTLLNSHSSVNSPDLLLTLISEQSTLHSIHSSVTLLTAHSSVHPHSSVHTPNSSPYTPHLTILSSHSILLTWHSSVKTPHSLVDTPHSLPHTPQFTLQTPHHTLLSEHLTLFTPINCLLARKQDQNSKQENISLSVWKISSRNSVSKISCTKNSVREAFLIRTW